MKRWTTLCAGGLRTFQQPQRWISYDKSALTKEALLQKVEAGIGYDVDGNPLKVDPDAKTVTTAVGELPLSPLMDPTWIRKRRRQKKDDPRRIGGRFRKKLANNPYAIALMTPLRKCINTDVVLPRYFFQDSELLKHPDPQQQNPWWAPGPLSFEDIVPRHVIDEREPGTTSEGQEKDDSSTETISDQTGPKNTLEASSSIATPNSESNHVEQRRPYRAPLTGYVLNRKEVVDAIGKSKDRRLLVRLIALRHGTAKAGINAGQTTWDPNMGDKVLQMLRLRVVDGLAYRAKRSNSPEYKFVRPCDSWDATKEVKLRGCVLWIPKERQDKPSDYATLDVEDAKYGSKMAVHNLRWLLGEEEVQKLRDESEMFREGELFVLKQWKSGSMMKLHQILWRLQGYLASGRPALPPTEDVDVDAVD